jgi:hypothetical protein
MTRDYTCHHQGATFDTVLLLRRNLRFVRGGQFPEISGFVQSVTLLTRELAAVPMAQRRWLLPNNALLVRTEARRRRACAACARAACIASFSYAPHQCVALSLTTALADHRARGLLAAHGVQCMRTVHAVRLATNGNGAAEVCVRSVGESRGRC